MHKKTIACLCLFLALATALAACAKHSRYGAVIVDSNGMEHIIMTDANGVTVCDDAGNLVEIITDSGNQKPVAAVTENGTTAAKQKSEYETNSITFPGVLTNKQEVADQYLTVSLSGGWASIDDTQIILEHEATGAQVIVYHNVADSTEEALQTLQESMAVLNEEDAYSETQAEIDGTPATCAHTRVGDLICTVYVFSTPMDPVCRITCTVEEDKQDQVDFSQILDTIRLK